MMCQPSTTDSDQPTLRLPSPGKPPRRPPSPGIFPGAAQIDVFLDRARSEGCVINENSLSSGMVYWGHEPFLTALWREPHVQQLYQLRDTALGVLEQ